MLGPVDFPAVLDAPAGEVIAGKYRVERLLGTGGMGTVVAATHLELGGLVALKFLNPEVAGQPEALARFQREARAMFALRGENVGRILDVGRLPSKRPFIVMEYLEGTDLEHVAEAGLVEIGRAVGYVLQACTAVAEAHAAGIIHRDLKPQNLFVTSRPDGTEVVKVLDFGISKMASPGDISLTSTSATIGSPRYMAPEQFESAALADERTDIWALGAVLFKLLTGRVPYDGDGVYSVLSKMLREPPPPPRLLRPDLPAGLSDAVLQALSRRPVDRFQSIAELAAAIAPYAGAHTPRTLPPPPNATAPKTASSRPPLPPGLGGPVTWNMLEPAPPLHGPLTRSMPGSASSPVQGLSITRTAEMEPTALAAPAEDPLTRSVAVERPRASSRARPIAVAAVFAAGALVLAGAIATKSRHPAVDASTPVAADSVAGRAGDDPPPRDPPSALSAPVPAASAAPVASASPSAGLSASASPSAASAQTAPTRPPISHRRPHAHPAPSASTAHDLMRENW